MLAWGELIHRYLLPRLFPDKKENVDPDQQVLAGIHKKGKEFNPGFAELKTIADSAGISLTIYLHAEQLELNAGKYNEQGDEIISWAEKNRVQLIKELDYKFTADDYRDGIHLNKNGQRKLASIMEPVMIEKISTR